MKPPYTLEPSKKLRENSDSQKAQRSREDLKSFSEKKLPKATGRGDNLKKTQVLMS